MNFHNRFSTAEGSMKKIYLLMEDKWHKRDVILPGMDAAFGEGNFTALDDPEEIPWDSLPEEASLFVSQKSEDIELPDGSKLHWISDERSKYLWDFVNGGGAALFIHCGTVLESTRGLYRELAGGSFIQHPERTPVTYVPQKGVHPIAEGAEPFTVMDEHYYCEIDVTRVKPFMIGGSEHNAGIITGWCQEIGKGRTAALTPGHTLDAATNPQMVRLVRNAAAWLTRR
jgi:type 1 glutamine amidotransferase